MSGWSLDRNQIGTWLRLGDACGRIARYLWKDLGSFPPFALQEYRRPERYGYMFHWRSQEDALTKANQSRDAFLPLFAMLSFVMAYYEHSSTSDDNPIPCWFRKLLRLNVSATWLHDLQLSDIGDVNCKRVGVVIDFTVTADYFWWINNLDFYVKAGIPVLINWGSAYGYVQQNDLFDRLRPSQLEFEAARLDHELWYKASMGTKRNVGHRCKYHKL